MYFPKNEWTLIFDGESVSGDVTISKKLLNKLTKQNKSNNNVPKSIKGDYDLSVHGNKIVLVDKNEGATVEAKCHPDDDFDIGTGIKEAFKKLNEKREEIRKQKEEEEEKKIRVGDWVEVIHEGDIFLIYSNFFYENNLEHFGRKFRYGCSLKNGDKLKVKFIKDDKVVLERKEKISSYGFQDCIYLMQLHGLKKVANPHV